MSKSKSPSRSPGKSPDLSISPFPLHLEDNEEAVIVNYRLQKRKRKAEEKKAGDEDSKQSLKQ